MFVAVDESSRQGLIRARLYGLPFCRAARSVDGGISSLELRDAPSSFSRA